MSFLFCFWEYLCPCATNLYDVECLRIATITTAWIVALWMIIGYNIPQIDAKLGVCHAAITIQLSFATNWNTCLIIRYVYCKHSCKRIIWVDMQVKYCTRIKWHCSLSIVEFIDTVILEMHTSVRTYIILIKPMRSVQQTSLPAIAMWYLWSEWWVLLMKNK